METEKAPESKPKQKKKGKIAEVFRLFKKGYNAKQISEKLGIDQRLVRSYIWRAKNPEKYKALLKRYFEKKRQKKETEAIKAAAKNQNSK